MFGGKLEIGREHKTVFFHEYSRNISMWKKFDDVNKNT